MTQAVQTFATHTLHTGTAPLVISVPHAGTAVPQELVMHHAAGRGDHG